MKCLFFLFFISFAGCSFYYEKEMEVTFQLSTNTEGIAYWLDENLDLQTKNAKNAISFCIKETQLTPVYFLSTDSYNGIATPIGCIIPLAKDLSIHGGFCAQVFIRLILQSHQQHKESQLYCSYFNWTKLYNVILEYENPFLLDMDKIVKDIAEDNFTVYSIKLKN